MYCRSTGTAHAYRLTSGARLFLGRRKDLSNEVPRMPLKNLIRPSTANRSPYQSLLVSVTGQNLEDHDAGIEVQKRPTNQLPVKLARA